MNQILLSLGGLLTAGAAYFNYRHQSGIDVETALAENTVNNTLSLLLIVITLVIWFVIAVTRLPKTKKEPAPKETEKKPVPVAAFLDKPLPPYSIAFYAAAFLLWCMASVFFILAIPESRKPADIILAITSVLSIVSFTRFALLYIRRKAGASDAILMPLPLLCLAVFDVSEYIRIMLLPQTSSYYAEILSMAAVLFSVFSFISHFFGREVKRSSLFFALSGASLGAVSYFSMALEFFTDGILQDAMTGGIYAFIAKLLLFASTSVLSIAYALMLWNAKKKTKH